MGPLEILAPSGGMLATLAKFLALLEIFDTQTAPQTQTHMVDF